MRLLGHMPCKHKWYRLVGLLLCCDVGASCCCGGGGWWWGCGVVDSVCGGGCVSVSGCCGMGKRRVGVEVSMTPYLLERYSQHRCLDDPRWW